jgi:hypothetical protein
LRPARLVATSDTDRCRYKGSTLVLTAKYSPDSTATNNDVCTAVCGIGM